MKRVSLLLLLVMSGIFAMANNRATLTYDFENGTTQGWTNIDADGDGYVWVSSTNPGNYHNSGVDLTGTGHNGSNAYVISGSYANQTYEALTPDNYFVSPQIALGGSITFYACGQDANYAAEHFGVAVSMTNNTSASAFSTIHEWTLTAKSVGAPTEYTRSGNRAQGAWYQFTVNLSAYAGQTGYVAIRHFNVTDEFILNVDDITIVEGNGGANNFTVTATANPLGGGTVSMNNYVVFNDDFENGIANWTTIDADGDGYTWYDLVEDNPNNILGHNGSSGFATSASAFDLSTALTPDNYLVSPHLALNGTFSFWANAQDASWPAEHFGVAISTTSGTEASAFTTIQQWTLSAKDASGVYTSDTRDGHVRTQGAWYLYSVDLSSYNGEMGYIAIRHFGCTDMFRINVDDAELRTSTSGSTVSGTYATGQSCTVTATPTPNSCYIFESWTENGTVVSTNPTYTFTVTNTHNLEANFALETYTITATPNPEEGGTVAINGSRNDRDELTYNFEDNTTQGWTAIDGDGDGYTWVLGSAIGGVYLVEGASLSGSGHDASVDLVCSGSYSNVVGALTPDNYLVSPQVELGGSITFWACGQDANYVAEHFGVAVSTTSSTSVSAFTTIQEWTMTAKGVGAPTEYTRSGSRAQGTWYQFTADLSAYAGQAGYVAIRHFNCTDMFILDVDDITIVEGNGGGGGGEGGDPTSIIYDFEDSTTQGWTSIDADGDGYDWVLGSAIGSIYLVEGASLAGTGHNSSADMMCSGSYTNYTSTALNPDNYLVSPQIELGGSITFWACGQDANYAAEHFGVAVSTTNNTDAAAFTTIQEWTLTAKGVGAPTEYTRSGNRTQGAWYQFTVDLSAYSGTGYVAIRHFNCSDEFILNIDDIEIVEGEGGGGGGEIGPGAVSAEVECGTACTLTATANECYAFVNWTENGVEVSTSPTYTFIVNGNQNFVANFEFQTYTITATPEPAEGGTVAIARGREELFFDFETGTMEGWTTIDADGDGHNWEMGSILMEGYSIPSHNEGEDCVTSQSYDGDTGVALNPDNYLVSPQVTLGGSITFWACAQDPDWAAEHFGVAVSTTSNTDGSAFTTIQEWTMTAKSMGQVGNYMSRSREGREGTWYEYNVDLSAYAGETGYVAIRHFNCSDMFYLNVDDITIVEGGNGGGEIGESVTADFDCGETCTLTATPNPNYEFVNWTENGVVVSTDAVYTFIVSGDRDLVANFSFDDAIGENNSVSIALYPNPVNDLLNVEASENIDNLEVYTITGALVYSNQNCSNKVAISTADFIKGTYIIRMTTQSATEVRSFVKY